MTTRVSGPSAVMDALRLSRPKFIDELKVEGDPNYQLLEELAALGLRVELRHEYTDPKKDVCIEPGTGPYCPLPTDDDRADDDFEDDEDY